MKAVEGISIRGIAAAVPRRASRTQDYEVLTENERERFAATTGISERRIVEPGQCTSDLCGHAADKLLASLGWERDSVDLLILVTQTPDYPTPATAILLQHRLGLPTSTLAFDVNLGCSCYPYALLIGSSILQTAGLKRALILAGDVSSRTCQYEDRSTWPLFGDAGSATAIEVDESADPMHFDLHSDGSGGNVIIIPGGGAASRNPECADPYLRMRGTDVFGFAISQAPKSIRSALDAAGWHIDDIDHVVLHQSNRMINETIRKKVGYPAEKVPSTLEQYGNTSSASVPLTLCATAGAWEFPAKTVLCGFGVGLSWGTATLTLAPGTRFEWMETDETYRA